MQDLNLFQIFTSRFQSLNINFIISGSVASIVYGDPRVTHDIDLVIDIAKHDVDNLAKVFTNGEFYLPPKEVINLEINRSSRGHFNIIHMETGFKADVYLSGNDEFQKWALQNRREIKFDASLLPIAPIEYLIIKKLEFYKEGKSQKHLTDIEAMLRESGDLINEKFLNAKLVQFGLEKEWEEAKSIG